MAEKRIVVEGKTLNFSGLFNLEELYGIIEEWFSDNGFSRRDEVEHVESVKKSHKELNIHYRPSKKLDDYSKVDIRFVITVRNLKKKVVTVDNHKVNMNEGDLHIKIDGLLVTDLEYRFENNPSFFFWRTVVDKIVRKSYTGKNEAKVVSLVNNCYGHLRSYLKATKVN